MIRRNEQTGKVILNAETVKHMNQEELAFIMFESIATIEGWEFQAQEASLEVAKLFREAAFHYISQGISPHDDKNLSRWFYYQTPKGPVFKVPSERVKSPIITRLQ